MNTFKPSAAKIRIILSLFYLLFYLMGCNHEVMAADASLEVAVPITESAKGDKLKKLLLKHPLYYSPHATHDEEDKKFCSTFYEDAKANTNIEYIEPVFRANDASDPRFKDYWQCMDTSKHPEYADPKYIFSSPRSFGARNYRLYRFGSDELLYDGTLYDEILYAELAAGMESGGREYSGYNFVDLENCVKYRFAATRPIDLVGQVRENINAFIRYHNQLYVYKLIDNTSSEVIDRYTFYLQDVDKSDSYRCKFSHINKEEVMKKQKKLEIRYQKKLELRQQKEPVLVRHAGDEYSNKKIQEYLTNNKLILNMEWTYSDHAISECRDIMMDIQTLKFTFIKPDVVTDDFSDPQLEPYKKKYPWLKYGIGRDDIGQALLPSWNINVYNINIDAEGDDNGELETVLYGERILIDGVLSDVLLSYTPNDYAVFRENPVEGYAAPHLKADPSGKNRKAGDDIFSALIKLRNLYAVLVIYDWHNGFYAEFMTEVYLLNKYIKSRPDDEYGNSGEITVRFPYHCWYDFE